MNNPKVSVIIPVYNTEAYVEQTLRSIMGQTLRDIELIVVNDGSTDGSLSVLERIATGDDRIRLYTQPNKGLSQTRNAGIARARGEFIYFMDSSRSKVSFTSGFQRFFSPFLRSSSISSSCPT